MPPGDLDLHFSDFVGRVRASSRGCLFLHGTLNFLRFLKAASESVSIMISVEHIGPYHLLSHARGRANRGQPHLVCQLERFNLWLQRPPPSRWLGAPVWTFAAGSGRKRPGAVQIAFLYGVGWSGHVDLRIRKENVRSDFPPCQESIRFGEALPVMINPQGWVTA